MTLARVRRPTCEARSAAWKASPITYTPPWKQRTTWRGSIPSTVISAVGTPPSSAAVTLTSAGSGCADSNSRSCRRCSLTSLPTGKADCRRIASRFSRCSVLTEDLPSVGLVWPRSRLARPCQSAAEISRREAGHYQACRQAGEEASPDHGDSRDRSTAEPIFRRQPCMCWFRPAGSCRTGGACRGLCGWHLAMCLGGRALLIQRPGAEQGAGEDAGGPPERGVVAMCQRQPAQG